MVDQAPPVCISDFEKIASAKLNQNAWNYYSSGADAMETLSENMRAFSRLRIRPRILRGTSEADTSTTVLGERISAPICIAPTAMQKMAHPEGECATVKASAQHDTCMILSSLTTSSIEEVAQACPGALRWFQLYIYKDREITIDLVHRAEQAGYKALVVTVDTPVLGRRIPDERNKMRLPDHLDLANFRNFGKDKNKGVKNETGSGLAGMVARNIDPSLSWASIDWLSTITTLPILIKGVLTREDAEEALKHDVTGIVVSNHGGRQLDGVPSTIEALPEVVQAVAGKMEVYLDGGVRTGTDVFKALALGAKAVFFGRPALWGLAHNGEEGVKEVLRIFKEEFQRAMMLAGCASIAEITPSMVVHESYYWKSNL